VRASDQPLLFAPEEIPEMAVPVSEASPEWRDACILKAAESIRFNPERLAEFQARVPGIGDPVEFLDFIIECAGGRVQ
jgi:hypothetical protein